MVGNRKIGIGMLMIVEHNEYFEIIAGNPARNEDINAVTERLEKINKSNAEELRELKHEYRKNMRIETGNANIGFIKIAMLSGNIINHSIKKINETTSFFSIRVKIKK